MLKLLKRWKLFLRVRVGGILMEPGMGGRAFVVFGTAPDIELCGLDLM